MPVIAAHEISVKSGSTPIYNGMDACLTAEIFEEIEPLGRPVIYDFELGLQGPVLEMILRGWKINADARHRGIVKIEEELTKLNFLLNTISEAIWDRGLNPNSSKQIKELFYDKIGIKPINAYVKGEVKTPMDRETLDRLWNHFEIRLIVQIICDIRDREKMLQVLKTEVDKDWRMRTSYNIGGTNEGRFSSSKSAIGSGGNLQNITEDLRHIFIADKNYKLVCIDLEQSDSRFVGYMCGVLFDDWAYLNAAESGDLHTTVARDVFDYLPWTGDLKKDRKIADETFHRMNSFRQAAKKIGHAVNFYGKAPSISRQTSVPERLVRQFIEKYLDKFPCISRWHRWAAQQLQTKRRVTNIFGYSRDFFGRPEDDETLKKVLAFLAASATANCLNLAMWRVWRYVSEVQLLAQLHDAYYFQFQETDEETERKIIKNCMALTRVDFVHKGRNFYVPGEAKSGWNWGPKTEENPQGLSKLGGKDLE